MTDHNKTVDIKYRAHDASQPPPGTLNIKILESQAV